MITRSTIVIYLCMTLFVHTIYARGEGNVLMATSEGEDRAPVFIDPVQGFDDEALTRYALEHNARIRALRYRLQEAKGRIKQSSLYPNPSLEFEYGEGAVFGSTNEQDFTLGIEQPFLLWGKRARRIESAQLFYKQTEYEIRDAERVLTSRVRALYVEVLSAIETADMIEQLLRVNLHALKLVTERVERGESAELEKMLLEVEVNRLKTEKMMTWNQLRQRMYELKRIVGWPLEKALKLKGTFQLSPDDFELPPTEFLLQLAQKNRPDLKALFIAEERADAEVRLAKAEAYPDIVGYVRYSRVKGSFDAFGLTETNTLTPLVDVDRILTVGISFDLPLWNRNQGRIASQKARKERLLNMKEYIRQVVEQEVASARTRVEIARNALNVFKTGVLEKAQKNLEIIREAYRLGELRMFDVITEQRRYIQIRREYINVLREYHLALIELERALALPLQEILKNSGGQT